MDVLLSWSRPSVSICPSGIFALPMMMSVGIGRFGSNFGRMEGIQLLLYLEDVEAATAGMLTNGQGWLFVKWQGKEDWEWDSKPILLSSRRNVEVIAQELHDRLAREHYLPLDSS